MYGSHYKTWDKHSLSFFHDIINPFIVLQVMSPSGNIYYITVCFNFLLCPHNGIANKVIQYRRDRTAWCVGVILQRELRTPGVISLCHKMTRHMNVREPLYDVNKTLTEAFHYIIIQLIFHNPNTDIVLQWTQPGYMCYIMGGFPFFIHARV